MTPGDFFAWTVALSIAAAVALGLLAAVIAGFVKGIGAIIEWFDKRKDRRARTAEQRKWGSDA